MNWKLAEEVAQGVYRENGSIRAALNSITSNVINLNPIFLRYVVEEVIFSPKLLNDDELSVINQRIGYIDNILYAKGKILPRNTIIAKEIRDVNRDNDTRAAKSRILLPFFSSHLAMPCKPGEHVWVIYEDVMNQQGLGYWVSRVVGFDHIDDVNHSHFPRNDDVSFSSQRELGSVPRYHFKNGNFIEVIDRETQNPGTRLDFFFVKSKEKQNPDNVYEDILFTSTATKATVKEPVPRFKKRPGDLALEGSNNSLIVLGNERSFVTDATVSSAEVLDDIKDSAGTIDMVVGRGSTQQTMGKIVNNDLKFDELDKFALNVQAKEGDPDFNSDRSRILLSQRTLPDAKFSIATYNQEKNKVSDSADGDAAIVIRTDKVRIIARSDVQLLVQGFQPTTNPVGKNVKESLTDTMNWASITIKSDGNIVFTPSDMGYIKLGGDDADKGILCTATPVSTVNGGVEGQPIGNDAGGRSGGSLAASPTGNTPAIHPANGTFANKVLVK
jgi:hypothetical protein